MTDWHPIETAPKDGTRILMEDSDGDIIVVWWDGFVWGDRDWVITDPTGWRPVAGGANRAAAPNAPTPPTEV